MSIYMANVKIWLNIFDLILTGYLWNVYNFHFNKLSSSYHYLIDYETVLFLYNIVTLIDIVYILFPN